MEPATQGKFATAAREVRVKSAMSPMLWMFGFCSLVFVPVSLVDPDPPVLYSVLALWVLSGLAAIGGFTYFMLTSPSRLQGERHIERLAALNEQARMGSPATISADASTGNPHLIEGGG